MESKMHVKPKGQIPDPPRVSGRPRSRAQREYIEYLQMLLEHPAVSEKRRQQIRAYIPKVELVMASQLKADLRSGSYERHAQARDDYEGRTQY
jgi:hypothetical protein